MTGTYFRSAVLALVSLTKRISVRGRRNVPRGSRVIFVSLHRADIDPFAITVGARREVRWVYADFLDSVPIVGYLLRRYGFVAAAYREITGISSVRDMVTLLENDWALGIFPEGALPLLTPGASRRYPFSPSFARLALITGSTVVPVSIRPRRVASVRYPVPSAIRRAMRLPETVAAIRRRLVYRGIAVCFGTPLEPEKGTGYRAFAQRVEAALYEMEENP